jgi:hypothetical protein
MSKQLTENVSREDQRADGDLRQRVARHPITLENTPEKTIEIMQAFPERAAKLRELIRGLRETDAG